MLCKNAIAGLLLLAVFASCFRHSAPASSSATAPLPAASSRWLFAAAPLPVAAMPRRSLQQHLCHGAPASNKPHPAEKRTPVRLAIWRTWAGFANSQLRRANFSALIYIYASLYICVHPHCCHLEAAAQTDANLSAHLHRLPTPPPYLRRMRLSPGRGADIGCWMRMALCQ